VTTMGPETTCMASRLVMARRAEPEYLRRGPGRGHRIERHVTHINCIDTNCIDIDM
jgi:hypothetical protein